jgi:hypothetical protein
MADKNISKAIRKRIITGVVQAVVLFAIFWGDLFSSKTKRLLLHFTARSCSVF